MGIEPTRSAWKADVLPLNYARGGEHSWYASRGRRGLVGRAGFEPAKAEPSDLQSDPFGHSGISPLNSRSLGIPSSTRGAPAGRSALGSAIEQCRSARVSYLGATAARSRSLGARSQRGACHPTRAQRAARPEASSSRRSAREWRTPSAPVSSSDLDCHGASASHAGRSPGVRGRVAPRGSRKRGPGRGRERGMVSSDPSRSSLASEKVRTGCSDPVSESVKNSRSLRDGRPCRPCQGHLRARRLHSFTGSQRSSTLVSALAKLKECVPCARGLRSTADSSTRRGSPPGRRARRSSMGRSPVW